MIRLINVAVFAALMYLTAGNAPTPACPVFCPAIKEPVCAGPKDHCSETLPQTYENGCFVLGYNCDHPNDMLGVTMPYVTSTSPQVPCILPCPMSPQGVSVCAGARNHCTTTLPQSFPNSCMVHNYNCENPSAQLKVIYNQSCDQMLANILCQRH